MTVTMPPNPWSFGPEDYVRATCPRCGARNERTAERKCKPTQDISGEYECPMTDARTDEHGNFLDISKAAIKRADREFEKWLETEDGKMWRDKWDGM